MKNLLLFSFSIICFYNTSAQNVGIGEPNPQTMLHIKSTLPEALRLQGPTPWVSFYDNTDLRGYVQALNTAISFGSHGANKLFLETDYTPRLTILSGGNVGINNSTPQANFHVSSPVAEVARIQGPAGYMSFYDNDTYTGYIQSSNNTLSFASAGTNRLALVTNFTERLTVSQNGNIGINNNNPSVNFHLTSATGEAMRIQAPSAYLSFYDNTNYTGYLQSSGSVMALAAQGSNRLGLFTGFAERLTVLPSGNIGVNKSSPTASLDVNGFTRLGSEAEAAPKIKTKIITGTTALNEDDRAGFAHGLNPSSIIAVNILVNSATFSGMKVPPNWSSPFPSGHEYQYHLSLDGIIIIRNMPGNSFQILNSPVTIFITYTE